jgi:hypothetical protein
LTYVALNSAEVSKEVIGYVQNEAIVIYYKVIFRNLPQGTVENLDNPQLELLDAVPADFSNRSRTQVGKTNYCLNSFLCMKGVLCLERNPTRPFSW